MNNGKQYPSDSSFATLLSVGEALLLVQDNRAFAGLGLSNDIPPYLRVDLRSHQAKPTPREINNS
eukprot:1944970-Amphidinium_carterae.2